MDHPVNVVVDHQRVKVFDIKHISVHIWTWGGGGGGGGGWGGGGGGGVCIIIYIPLSRL